MGHTIDSPGESLTASASGRKSALVRSFQQLYSRPTSAIGTTIFIVFLAMAVFGPLIAPYGENQQFPLEARQPPSTSHWFGTDQLGRDVFSRVVLGARDILLLAGLGTLLAVVCGSLVGLFSGYRGGWIDEGSMRLFDSLLAIPALLFALLLLGALGPARNTILIVLVIVYTPIVARVVRSVVLSLKTRGFIEAARLQGESQTFIITQEILPSVLPTLAVETALRFSYAIFLVASLGFLGAGVQPPSPDWGLMVKESRNYVNLLPWMMFFPAAAIAILVIGINLMADGIKRVLLSPE